MALYEMHREPEMTAPVMVAALEGTTIVERRAAVRTSVSDVEAASSDTRGL